MTTIDEAIQYKLMEGDKKLRPDGKKKDEGKPPSLLDVVRNQVNQGGLDAVSSEDLQRQLPLGLASKGVLKQLTTMLREARGEEVWTITKEFDFGHLQCDEELWCVTTALQHQLSTIIKSGNLGKIIVIGTYHLVTLNLSMIHSIL